MFIIIEGADLVGKTTIVKKLITAIGNQYKCFNWFSKVLKERYPNNWMNYIDIVAEAEFYCLKQFQDQDAILDRSIISSIIYNKVYERGYDTNYITFKDLIDVRYIYVTVDKDTLLKRIGQREESEIIKERIFKIRQAYEEFFSNFMFPYLELDGTESPEINLHKILDYIK